MFLKMRLLNLIVIVVTIVLHVDFIIADSFHEVLNPNWDEIDRKNYCGVANFHGFDLNAIARFATDGECGTDIAVYINRCCYHHDQCYDKELKRELCDASFCHCMNQYSYPKKGCKALTDLFCLVVKDFGAKYWG